MSVTATPVFPQALKTAQQTFAIGDTTTNKTVVSAGSNGSKIDSLMVSSTDTSDRDIQIFLTSSSTNYLLATVKVPLGSGNADTIAAVDVLHSGMIPGLPLDANGNRCLTLAAGWSITAAMVATVTTAKTVTVLAMGSDF